ncbi:MAG TPA: RluA family pseudouridine synthase [Geobacteraceae bacterium]|nr:RluA family pseudouridine synthase [Geobacteraceae bacterium]
MILKASVGREEAGMRLDDGARTLFPRLSKGEIRRIIDRGGCTVGGVLVRVASRSLREGDEIALGIMEQERFVDLSYTSGDMLFEDREYLAVNKKAGINSQRTPYQLKGTVEYAVEQYLKASGVNEPARVIHRLDIGTSGVMFFPKKKGAATHVSALLKAGKVEKRYWALVQGDPETDEWRDEGAIARLAKFRYGVATKGMRAVTLFRVIARGSGAALVEARPLTGRTHQIRVHLAHRGLPVIGDQAYGGPPASRMMLHCHSMSFCAADSRQIHAMAPIDEEFINICAEYGVPV